MDNSVGFGAVMALAILIVLLVFTRVGMKAQRSITKTDIELCGHTLECYEKVVFPPKRES